MSREPGQKAQDKLPAGPIEGGSAEDIVEEAIGFNLRSLRTLRDLLLDPKKVFAAYVAGERIYTPALRIWLSLTGVQVLVGYIFGGHDRLFMNAYANWPEQTRNFMLGEAAGEPEAVAAFYADAFSLLQPPLVALATATSVLLIALISGRLRWATRLNISFAVLTAGSIFGLAIYPFSVQRPDLGMVIVLPVLLIYFLTYVRGSDALPGRSGIGRTLKALGLSLYLVVMILIAGMAGFYFALDWAKDQVIATL